jgi:hypothetical protein
VNYSHNSDNRNNIWNADVSFSNEYDYTSIGFGGGFTKLFNEKNTEISVKNAYLDQWRPIYPIELREYAQYGASFQNTGYFSGVPVFDQNGARSQAYLPAAFEPTKRQTEILFCFYFSFSDIDKRFNYLFWMFCNRKVCWERHIKESILLIKQIIM